MYKHVVTTLAATVTGLTLMAGPASAAADPAEATEAAEATASRPCAQGNLALQAPPTSDSVLDVISAAELLQGLFGPVDRNGFVDRRWTSSASLPGEDEADAFAQGLLADVYRDPYPAPYQAEPTLNTAPVPSLVRSVGVDDLLQGVVGATTMVCVTGSGAHAVSTSPYGSAAVGTWWYDAATGSSPYTATGSSPYTAAAGAWPYGAAVNTWRYGAAVNTWPNGPAKVSTSNRSGSLLDALGVTRVVEEVTGGLRP